MNFQEAIRKIEERGDFNRYAEMKPIFEEQLNNLTKDDHTERGLAYYYLLVSYLKAHLVHETEESITFYEEMDREFFAQEAIYKENPQKFSSSEIQDFYRLLERCYNSLEFLYQSHSFKLRRNSAYERKMQFRQTFYRLNKEWLNWCEYKFLEITCQYGNSLLRWAFTTLLAMLLFAIIYWAADQTLEQSKVFAGDVHWYDYFYFSIIVATTVGLGDIYPVTVFGKILVSIEAFVGFLMFGIFIGLIHKKL